MLLPAPESPMMPNISPSFIVMLMSFIAVTLPFEVRYVFSRFLSSIIYPPIKITDVYFTSVRLNIRQAQTFFRDRRIILFARIRILLFAVVGFIRSAPFVFVVMSITY